MKDERRLQTFISRYQQKVFALVLCLVAGDLDSAYEITVSSFVEALGPEMPAEDDVILAVKVLRSAVTKSLATKTIPSFDTFIGRTDSPEQKQSLRFLLTALQRLPAETRALLLLRDQVHVSSRDLAAVLDIAESDVRIRLEDARAKLRDSIEEVIKDAA